MALINDLENPKFIEKLPLGKNCKIDTSSIVLAGHSFGGITALSTGNLSEKVKAVIALDPWLFPYEKEIKEGSFKL